ncbi:MAG: DegT/DnrJ/EryC1/StrS family aminotransferase [Lentisphaerae bacterium]|nr:DegT/DnrJ/EryC1/StrS family aminotransferase [Lentisphaerota bacterium]
MDFMSQLAIEGGNPVFTQPAPLPAWPPIYQQTGEKLLQIYNSHRWSFYGSEELAFNEEFAAYTGAAYCSMMANGTVTLELALLALGVGPGDEVIVPAHTWLATGEAVVYTGATPVIVDIEPDTLCMDPEKFEQAITPKTKAVIPVHLFGSMADLDRILAIAAKHNIKVIEDCAHSHGGEWRNRHTGTWGDIGSFSFQESKLIASGEGGACITNDEILAEKLGRLSHIGYQIGSKQGQKGTPPPMGLICRNYRVTEFQAAILSGQLAHLKEDTIMRERNAEYLRKRIDALPGIKVQARGKHATRQSYYIFSVIVDIDRLKQGTTRSDIALALQAEGISRIGGGWGRPMYHQNLWSVPEDMYRIESNANAEEIVCNRLLVCQLQWLMLPEKETAMVADAFEKVMTHYYCD